MKFSDRDEITFIADEDAVAELSVALVEAGVALLALIPNRPSLEELFFRITEGDGVGPGSSPKRESRVLDVA